MKSCALQKHKAPLVFTPQLRIFNSATFTDEEIADLHANSEYPLNQKVRLFSLIHLTIQNTIFDTSYSAVPTSMPGIIFQTIQINYPGGESEGAYVIPMSQLF